jgi:hypothetical protein
MASTTMQKSHAVCHQAGLKRKAVDSALSSPLLLLLLPAGTSCSQGKSLRVCLVQ